MGERRVYAKIVVAYDGSAAGGNCLRQAAGLARVCGAELHILGIVPTSGGFAIAQATSGMDVFGMKRQMIEKSLAEADAAEDCHGVQHVIALREGDPAAEIVAHAREIKADLVVLGQSDRGRLSRWFAGSTANTLLQYLPCSLLIAP